MTPSLETLAGLYQAYCDRAEAGNHALDCFRKVIASHGYTEEQVAEAAMRQALHPEAKAGG